MVRPLKTTYFSVCLPKGISKRSGLGYSFHPPPHLILKRHLTLLQLKIGHQNNRHIQEGGGLTLGTPTSPEFILNAYTASMKDEGDCKFNMTVCRPLIDGVSLR